MKQALIIILSVLISVNLNSQDKSSLDFSVGIGNSSRILKNIDGSSIPLTSGNDELAKMNWKASLTYSKPVANSILFRTGLEYSTLNYYNFKDSDLRWPSQHNGNGGFEPGPISNNATSSASNRFIGIPILIRAQKSAKKISPFIEVGTSLNYYITSSSKLDADMFSSNESARREYDSLNIFASLSLGANYQVGSAFQLFSNIYYHRQLNNFSEIATSQKLYEYGLGFGVRKLLKAKTESKNNEEDNL